MHLAITVINQLCNQCSIDVRFWLERRNLKNGICFQDVFLMIRRKKLTIFTDAKDTTSVLELKKMIEGGCDYRDMRKFYL